MSNCCTGFETNVQEAKREPNAVMRPLNNCGNKAVYKTLKGLNYRFGTPVSFDTKTGVVYPSNSNVIGISLSEISTASEDDKVIVQRTGYVNYSDVGEALKNLEIMPSYKNWCLIHAELAKVNIYVEYK